MSAGKRTQATKPTLEKRYHDAVDFTRNYSFNAKIESIYNDHFSQLPGVQTFRNILNSPDLLHRRSTADKELFCNFQKRMSQQRPFDVYRSIFEALETTVPQDGISAYAGSYKCYRPSTTRDSLVSGTISIERSEAGWGFTHASKQQIHGELLEFKHNGPVYLMSNRLYLLGVGSDEGNSYLRPMVLRVTDSPKKKPLIGIVLTETSDLIPLASKTVLLSQELDASWKSEKDFDSRVARLLKNESRHEHAVFGWGNRNDRSTRSAR